MMRCLVLNLEYGQDNGGLVTVASSIKKLLLVSLAVRWLRCEFSTIEGS